MLFPNCCDRELLRFRRIRRGCGGPSPLVARRLSRISKLRISINHITSHLISAQIIVVQDFHFDDDLHIYVSCEYTTYTCCKQPFFETCPSHLQCMRRWVSKAQPMQRPKSFQKDSSFLPPIANKSVKVKHHPVKAVNVISFHDFDHFVQCPDKFRKGVVNDCSHRYAFRNFKKSKTSCPMEI